MCIKVYVADISPLLNNSKLYDKIYSLLPDYRKQKTDKMRFQKDKCLSVGVGFLLKKAVADFGFCGIDNRISYNEYQKPYFTDNSAPSFNLSHSGTKVMCAVSSSPIGCDVEKVDEKHINVASKAFSESENKILNSSTDKVDTFFRLWALKESFMKLLGLGFSLPTSDFSIILDDKITVCQDRFDGKFDFLEFDICDDYKFSCAVKDCKNPVAEVVKIDFDSLF